MTPSQVEIRIQVLPHAEGLGLPVYATDGAAGMDLRAAVETLLRILPGERVVVPTGLRIEVPPGYEAQVRARSGLALRRGITLPNAPGTIDSDYRGEVGVILHNLGRDPFDVERGARIAQLVVAPVVRGVWRQVARLEETARGEGGFGHTGRA